MAAAWGGRIVVRVGRPLVVAGTLVMAAGIAATLVVVRILTDPSTVCSPPSPCSSPGSGAAW